MFRSTVEHVLRYYEDIYVHAERLNNRDSGPFYIFRYRIVIDEVLNIKKAGQSIIK